MAYGNTASLVPLQQLTPNRWQAIIDTLEAQTLSDFLPKSYTTEQLSGFGAQRLLLINSLKNTDNAVIEVLFRGASSITTVVIKGISRGTVLLNTSDIYAEPVLDFGTFHNLIDASIMGESHAFVRRWHKTDIMLETFDPVPLSPGTNVTTHDGLVAAARSSISSSSGHLSGTCALTPHHLGGVIGTDLLVYGMTGLSVVDASVMPLIPGAHLVSKRHVVRFGLLALFAAFRQYL